MSFARLAEEKIRQAMQAGEFDNLRGKGQPLCLESDNPHQKVEDRLAHHLLKQNGFSLPWIEVGREIDADLQALHAWLRLRRRQAVDEAQWQLALREFARRLAHLNRRIRDLNLQVPGVCFQRRALQPERETRRALGSEYLG